MYGLNNLLCNKCTTPSFCVGSRTYLAHHELESVVVVILIVVVVIIIIVIVVV